MAQNGAKRKSHLSVLKDANRSLTCSGFSGCSNLSGIMLILITVAVTGKIDVRMNITTITP